MALKSDGEAAVMALKGAIAAERRGSTPLIESPVRESKGNADVERAPRTWQGQFRCMKHVFEEMSGLAGKGLTLPLDHLLTGWLAAWACEVRFKIGSRRDDGRTKYEAMVGHRCRHPVLEFGEIVVFRTALDKSRRHKSDDYWYEGAFSRG